MYVYKNFCYYRKYHDCYGFVYDVSYRGHHLAFIPGTARDVKRLVDEGKFKDDADKLDRILS